MNKKKLIRKIAADAGITQGQANEVFNSFTAAVVRTIKREQSVTLVGFGSFSLLKKVASKRRNPRTGTLMRIRARRTAKFNPSPNLINQL